jgi:tetratricopeptide (TPR) repeat protein
MCDAYRVAGERVRNVEYLGAAVEAGRAAVAACPEGRPQLAGYLSNLAMALRSRFELARDGSDIEEAVTIGRRSVAAAHDGHPRLGRYLNNLGIALAVRHEQTGRFDDPDEAVETLRRSVRVTPAAEPERPMYHANLGLSLIARYERIGAAPDLDEAVRALEVAVSATSPDDPALGARQASLDKARDRRERLSGEPSLESKIADLRRELAVVPPADPEFSPRATTLATLLNRRFFETTGELEDLDESIELSRQVVAATPAGDERLPGRLSTLGAALAMRAERSGDASTLREAIEAFRAAVEATAPDDEQRAWLLTNLALALKARHVRNRDLASIDEAAEAARASLRVSSLSQPSLAILLSNLGSILQTRFQRTGSTDDLDEAVDAGRRAVSLTPEADVHRAGRLANLSRALEIRADAAGAPEDLDAAVEEARRAVAGKSPGDHFWPEALNVLGVALRARAERGGSVADLDEALENFRAATDATPAWDAAVCSRLANVSMAAHQRFRATGARGDFDEAISACRRGVAVATAPAASRADLGARWGQWAAEQGEWELAVEGYAETLELLAQVAARGLDRADQEHGLSQLGSPGTTAAACCLQFGDAARAAELWEQGRGVLLGHALDVRTSTAELAERHPADAARFAELGATLDGLPFDAHEARRVAAGDLEVLIAAIRERAGFERFLRPAPVDALLADVREGPVVLVNLSDVRSDALILTPDGLDTVPLPGVTPETVVERVVDVIVGLEPGSADEERVTRTLAWLWDEIAGPVLDRLGFTAPEHPGTPWQRIWWCPSGILSFLPLHAAGHHDTRFEPGPRTVLDRVVSSYTPTLRALRHARRRLEAGSSGAAVVAMPETPGAGALPGAAKEAALLRELLGARAQVLEGPAATHDAVLSVLPTARWAHFACHGESPIDDPAAGRLLLHDHATAPLRVLDVMRMNLEGAELAFLSACETARTGASLADEATHLASAFQLAGYRHVIATLWPISDRAAVLVARAVYSSLLADDDGPAAAAVALHGAVRRLRSVHPDRPSLWAAFTHNGA